MMSVGTGGFSGASAATGPVAGFDPLLDFRKKMARRVKDHPFAQDYKAKRKKAKKLKEDFKPHMMYDPKTGKGYNADTEKEHLRMKKMGYSHSKIKESVEKPCPTPHLYQYKVSIPEVGDTIIYASSQAELMMKLRLLVNPRYRGEIKIDRIFPSEAGKFYNEKRMKAYKNIPEETEDPAAAAAKKQGVMMKKQAAQKQVQGKIAAEKKKIALKKQEMQRSLQTKIAVMKKGATAGQSPIGATEEFVHESSGGNIDAIKTIADSNQPGKIQFLNGESFQLQPAIAQKIFQAYEQLGVQKNRAKFSNAANETTQSFEKILSFVGAQG